MPLITEPKKQNRNWDFMEKKSMTITLVCHSREFHGTKCSGFYSYVREAAAEQASLPWQVVEWHSS